MTINIELPLDENEALFNNPGKSLDSMDEEERTRRARNAVIEAIQTHLDSSREKAERIFEESTEDELRKACRKALLQDDDRDYLEREAAEIVKIYRS